MQQRSAHSGTHVKLDVRCRRCGGDNYARHKYCGWCGLDMDAAASIDEVTAHAVSIPGIGGDSTSPGQVAAEATTPGMTRADGVVVSMLGNVAGGRKSMSQAVIYRLDLGEPFDVNGPDLEAPGTFTATADGLRLDSLGSLEGVYRRVRRDEKPIAYRRLRVIRELGTFQALAPGENIPVGCMAILDQVLVRIEPT